MLKLVLLGDVEGWIGDGIAPPSAVVGCVAFPGCLAPGGRCILVSPADYGLSWVLEEGGVKVELGEAVPKGCINALGYKVAYPVKSQKGVCLSGHLALRVHAGSVDISLPESLALDSERAVVTCGHWRSAIDRSGDRSVGAYY